MTGGLLDDVESAAGLTVHGAGTVAGAAGMRPPPPPVFGRPGAAATTFWPRISPADRSPGPVPAGSLPSFVWTLL